MKTSISAIRPVRMSFSRINVPVEAEFIRHGHQSVRLMNCAIELSRLSQNGKIKLFVRPRSRNGKSLSHSLQIYYRPNGRKQISRLNDQMGAILAYRHGVTSITIKKNSKADDIYFFLAQTATKQRIDRDALAIRGIKILFEGEESIYPSTEAVLSFDPYRV